MEQITDLLRELAAQLGVGAEYLWPLLVKQTIVKWWSMIIMAGILIVSGLLTIGLAFLGADKLGWEDGGAFIGVVGFLATGAGIVTLAVAVTCLDYLLVPEAATIQRLLEMM